VILILTFSIIKNNLIKVFNYQYELKEQKKSKTVNTVNSNERKIKDFGFTNDKYLISNSSGDLICLLFQHKLQALGQKLEK